MARLPLEPIDCPVLCVHKTKCWRRYPSTHRFHKTTDGCLIELDPPAETAESGSSPVESPTVGEDGSPKAPPE